MCVKGKKAELDIQNKLTPLRYICIVYMKKNGKSYAMRRFEWGSVGYGNRHN